MLILPPLHQLTREYATISASPPPYITAHPSESNILEWHYILTGPPSTPYEGGQYWGTLLFPPEYPFAPPAIRMHTPSGRFQPSTRLCLSISDFHPRSFNPAWEVSTILLGLQSFMTSEEMTTGSLAGSESERKWYAARSRWWNSTGGGSCASSPSSTDRSTTAAKGVSATKRGGGVGAVKAGDGGVKFRAEWEDLDGENWEWMQATRIDPRTGELLPRADAEKESEESGECSREVRALRLGPKGAASGLGSRVREGQQVGRGWVGSHGWKIGLGLVFAWVLLGRLFADPL